MKRARKQSSDRASRLAGQLLSDMKPWRPTVFLLIEGAYPATIDKWHTVLTVGELRTLCASVLSQDETKGPRITISTRGVSKSDYLFRRRAQ